MLLKIISLCLILFPVVNSPAQSSVFGGRGLFRTLSAQTLEPGSFLVHTVFATYRIDDQERSKPVNILNLGLTYGWKDNLELSTHLTPYQSIPSKGRIFAGHSSIAIKWQTPFSGSVAQTALQAMVKLSLSKKNNLAHEPFSSNAVAWGARALFAVRLASSFPVKLNINIGYLDHEIDSFLKSETTDQLVFGAGLKIGTKSFIYYSEFSGELFLNKPDLHFGNNSIRFTQGVKFRGPFKFLFDLGGDLGLSQPPDIVVNDVHRYAQWRIFAGLTYHVRPQRYFQKRTTSKNQLNEKAVDRLRNQRKNIDAKLDEILKELEAEPPKEKKEK